MDVKEYMKDNLLLFDGAIGTMLQKAGLAAGGLPEVYNIEHPDIVRDIHRAYAAAGCDVVTANTFQANELKLKGCGYTPEELITAGVNLAKESGAAYVALDMGPLGQLMEPMGTMTFDRAYELYQQQIDAGVKAGADLLLFETMSDLLEVRASVLAAKENCSLPVFVTMTFQEDGRTFVGCDPTSVAVTLSGLKVDALGVNCSLGPEELIPVIDELLRYSRVPLMVQPNAGLPKIENGQTVYRITVPDYVSAMTQIIGKGAAILGGCCGTTPEFIAALRPVLNQNKPKPVAFSPVTAVSSGTQTVILDDRISVIGERINPTGKKVLKEKLRTQDFDYMIGEAITQAQHGADILDVNCGLPEIDEAQTLSRAVKEIQAVTNLPLQLDSSDIGAIETAIRKYNGKPIINSVNGKQGNMDAVFPIVQKYGAVVIGLCLDESGIPPTAEGRLDIARKIVNEAARYGIPKEDIVIDCLVLTASAQQELVVETLKAIRLVKAELGVKTVLGVSNVSFGLPQRPVLNSVFLAAGFGAGLDTAIINPMSEEVMQVVRAYKVLNNQDRDAIEYIEAFSAVSTDQPQASAVEKDLKDLIIEGRKEEARQKTIELLQTQAPLDVIDQHFIPALDIVGDRYEKGTIFLPQLIQSAEAVKGGFTVIKDAMPAGDSSASKGKVVVATVEGDIHDIGKNIAKMLLENYGYDVIDLGKDVPIAAVVEAAMTHQVRLIGLSALMTTTVKSMKDTISALKAAGCQAKIMVGGAVLNEEYVEFVGADFYAKDARAGVQIANSVFASA